MDTEQDTEYFEQIVGACIVAVHDDDESIWLHLSDGSAVEFYSLPLPDGGFDFEIHEAGVRH